jgi:hypothetical protein
LPAAGPGSASEFLDPSACPRPDIQDYVNAIPINHDADRRSCRCAVPGSRAHCIEGAFFAACALWVHGEPPLVMHLDCDPSDFPHVVALFRRGGQWGAISKTNGAPLRYRDPIYRSLRELAMSYFHEYYDKRGYKTLRSYSGSFDMRRIEPEHWVTSEKSCWAAHDRLAALRHYPLISARQARLLSRRDPFERRAAKMVQYEAQDAQETNRPAPPIGVARAQ